MVMDALRGYMQLASGLTEVTRQRAQQAAKQLLQQTGADSLTTGLTGRVSELADEIVATSKSNRALLQAIVGNEVEGAVAKLGFVRAEEVAVLRRRIEKLEQEKSAAATSAPTTPPPVPASVAGVSGGSTAKKTPVKKTPVTKAAAPKTTPSTPFESASKPAKKAAAKKAAAKKATAEKATAKKTAAKKSAAKKA